MCRSRARTAGVRLSRYGTCPNLAGWQPVATEHEHRGLNMKHAASRVFPLEPGVHRITLASGARAGQVVCVLSLLGGPAEAAFRHGTGSRHRILRHSGDTSHVMAHEPLDLLVAVVGESREATTAAEIVVEPVGDGPDTVPTVPSAGRGGSAASAADFRGIAHVERRGDVRFKAGEWVGNAKTPGRIEGLTLEWPACPPDVSVAYRAVMANGDRTGWMPLGSFAGTKGRALAIASLGLALSGAGAAAWSFDVEALFQDGRSNQQMRHARGATLVVTGANGRQALVGLRISIVRAHDLALSGLRRHVDATESAEPTQQQAAAPTARVPEVHLPAPGLAPPPPLNAPRSLLQRVRVFRSPRSP